MFWEVYFYIDSLAEIYNNSISKNCYDSIIIKENFYKKLESLMYSFIIKLIFDNLTEENIEENKLTNINYIKENFGFGKKDLLKEELSDPMKLNFDRKYYLKMKKGIIQKSHGFENYFKEIEEQYELNEVEKYIASKKLDFNETQHVSTEINSRTKIFEEAINNKISFNDFSKNKSKKIAEKVAEEMIKETMQITNWDVGIHILLILLMILMI